MPNKKSFGMDNKEKIKRLQKLKWYVLNPGNYGFYSHVYYRVLRQEFPFHFIEFIFQHRDPNQSLEWIKYEDRMIGDTFRFISGLYACMEKYAEIPAISYWQRFEWNRTKTILADRSLVLDDEPSSQC